MTITDVRVRKITTTSAVRAIASIVIDDCFIIKELRIIEGTNGLFVAMPRRATPNGDMVDIVHPLNSETRAMIEEAVLKAYNEAE
jgi:putative septation protein spoVG